MMSKAEVRAIVDDNLVDLATAVSLGGWRLTIEYDTDLGKDRASCRADPKRHHATIAFNPAEFDDEKDVLEGLLHELLHVYHAEFDLYREAVRASVACQIFDVMEPTFENACEHVVDNVVGLLKHTFKTTPKKMIAAVRRREADE